MKLISYNINGIRAAIKKGLVDWIKKFEPDIFCLQEVKAECNQVDLTPFKDLGYEIFWHAAKKRGYSGVAIFTKIQPIHVSIGGNHASYDSEGRIITLEYESFSLMNVYIPSGTNPERQGFKMNFLSFFKDFCKTQLMKKKHLVVCGDFNICHKAIDIHNPVSNKNSSGFLPEERAWVDEFLDVGFVDTFRLFNENPHHYSWWTYRFNARNNNKGWRIDYWMASQTMKDWIQSAFILPEVKHSDHCPVGIDLLPKKSKA